MQTRGRWTHAALAVLIGACGAPSTTTSSGADDGPVASGDEVEELPRCRVPNPPAEDLFRAGEGAAEAGDAAAAAAQYRAACEGGNPCGCSELGFALATGEGLEPDVAGGSELLGQGCEGGDAWGCFHHAEVLFRLRRHTERARDAYAAACEGEIGDACFELGRMAMSGVGGSQDAAAAAESYRRACEHGVVSACRALGEDRFATVGGDGEGDERAQARELISWGCETAQDAQSCRSFALLWPEDAGAAAALQRACADGDRVACDLRLEDAAAREGDVSALDRETTDGIPVVAAGASAPGLAIVTDVDVGRLGLRPACVGRVGRTPTALIEVTETDPPAARTLAIRATADADSVLVVHGPSGWYCGDDSVRGSFHPQVSIAGASVGTYRVWIGGFDVSANGAPAQLEASLSE